MSIKKLKLRLIKTGGGLFHDSRADSRLLADQLNRVASKVDELIDFIEKQQKEIENLKSPKP